MVPLSTEILINYIPIQIRMAMQEDVMMLSTNFSHIHIPEILKALRNDVFDILWYVKVLDNRQNYYNIQALVLYY